MPQLLPVLGFDTETTGVNPQRDRIVTAALVWRQADGTITERGWLINPGVEIPATASAVHGITTEYAQAHGLAPRVALDEIASALAADADTYAWVAFNASYDLAILRAELERYGLPGLEERLGRATGPVLDPLVLDRAADRYRRGKRTLGDLVQHYRVEVIGDLHEAAADVRCTIAVLDAILAAFPELAAMSLVELHDWQVVKHRAWAERFNDYLHSQGRVGDVGLVWP